MSTLDNTILVTLFKVTITIKFKVDAAKDVNNLALENKTDSPSSLYVPLEVVIKLTKYLSCQQHLLIDPAEKCYSEEDYGKQRKANQA